MQRKLAKASLSSRTLQSQTRELEKALFSLSEPKRLLAALGRYGWQMLILATQARRVTSRVRFLFRFVHFLIRMDKHHGPATTISWLKAGTVAVQRAVAKDPVRSLRAISPGLPLPRLSSSGFPVIFSPIDRRKMVLGDEKMIRYGLTLLSIYRVLECPVKTKLETITDPYSGKPEAPLNFAVFVRQGLWPFLKSLHVTPKMVRVLSDPGRPYTSRSAGPNVSMAIGGILTDTYAWLTCDHIGDLLDYFEVTGSHKLLSLFESIGSLVATLESKGWRPPVKADAAHQGGPRLGQLSTKVEAAGKLRVFAITDWWTQMAVKPLHVSIFAIIAKIPMDGTFDQEAQAKRLASLSVKRGCAFSFDLTSATDRLPVVIQASILDELTGKPGFGEKWSRLLVNRDWVIPEETQGNYQFPKSVKYAVGQPMGALSSWAMLALTHHMLVQYAAYCLGYAPGHFQDYGIIGDDIVICDEAVSHLYHSVVTDLGVGINDAKSLRSKGETPALEFAKRTFIGEKDVSPISFKQLASATSLAGRVQNLLYFGYRGLVQTVTTFGVILARFPSDMWKPWSRVIKTKGFQHGLIGALGNLHRKGFIPLELLIEACANPDDPEFDFAAKESFAVPSAQLLSLLIAAFNSVEGVDLSKYPFSGREARVEYRKDIGLSDDLLLLALKARKKLADEYDDILLKFTQILLLGTPQGVGPKPGKPGKALDTYLFYENLREKILSEIPVEGAQLLSIAEIILLGSKDPCDYYDQLLAVLEDERHEPLPLQDALKVSEDTLLYTTSFSLSPAPQRARSVDEAWIALRLMRHGLPNVRVWENPTWTMK